MKHKFALLGIASAFCCLPFFSSCNSDDEDKYYMVTGEPADSTMGYVTGGGKKYRLGDVAQLTATPKPGYVFYQWQDSVSDNPRRVDVVNVADYVAYFRVANEGLEAGHLGGVISGDLTLKKIGTLKTDYIIDTVLVVDNASLLTVEPGVTLEFANEKACIIVESGAGLKMEGTSDKPIKLKGANDNSQKGSWSYVEYRSDREENSMSFVSFNNGGNEADKGVLRLTGNANLSVENCTFAGGLGLGITADEAEGDPFRSFSGNTISNMASYPMRIRLAQVSSLGNGNQFLRNDKSTANFILVTDSIVSDLSVTFRKQSLYKSQEVPFLMENGMLIYAGGRVNVEAGVAVAFSRGNRLWVSTNGILQIEGTMSSLVRLVGEKSGEPGFWKGVDFRSNVGYDGGNYIKYCFIDGGGSDENGACLSLTRSAKLTMSSVQFFNSANYGLKVALNPSTAKLEEGISAENLKFGNNKLGMIYDATTEQALDVLP